MHRSPTQQVFLVLGSNSSQGRPRSDTFEYVAKWPIEQEPDDRISFHFDDEYSVCSHHSTPFPAEWNVHKECLASFIFTGTTGICAVYGVMNGGHMDNGMKRHCVY
ncbi:hypothetical protein TNCV_2219121 [Trichonephila clavipes]|nr:hypothetical protein TNCV_2219121 [Trichonephila clavipes]